MKVLKSIQNASRMLPEAFRDVRRCLQNAQGDVECLTASYLPGNQVDGLPGIAVLGRKCEGLRIFQLILCVNIHENLKDYIKIMQKNDIDDRNDKENEFFYPR